MASERNDYKIVRSSGSDAELEQYRQCFVDNGFSKKIEALKWFHQDNPAGFNIIYHAILNPGNRLSGIFSCLPSVFNMGGNRAMAMHGFDVLTDYRHRQKGLLLRLERTLTENTKGYNFEFIYGFANVNSVHGITKRSGFKLLGEMPFLIKPLRVSYILRRLVKKSASVIKEDNNWRIPIPLESPISKGHKIVALENFGEDYEGLWDKIKDRLSICVNRDAAYMIWRYVKKPNEIYYKYGLFDQGELQGIVVFTLKNKHGGKIGYIMEMLYLPGEVNAGKTLLKFASTYLRKNGADVLLAWCYDHSYNFEAYRKAGFFRFPEKLRPQKLFFVLKPLKNESRDVYDSAKWYLSYSDSDTV